MIGWQYAQAHPSEALAHLHFFSVKKEHQGGEIDVRITVQEFATPEVGAFKFLAIADIELNQDTAAFHPTGFSNTLMDALSECLKRVREFDYEGSEHASTPVQA
jgi:hypothetical protein